MKNITSTRLLMVLAMLIGTLPAVMATDRLFIDAVNFEPGETKALVLGLDNSQDFFGFQFDMKLPDGMSFVRNGDKADCTLSSRVGSDYAVVSNVLSDNHARLGAFSTSHIPISGTSGTLIYVNVKASDDFAGGILELSDILFTDASNRDVALPGFFLESGTRHDDRFYIPDFRIAAGETKEISLILDNETAFTAFQTDIYLPEGLSIVEGSPVMSGRGCGHTVSARAFSDGRVRLACLSLGNDVFTGNSGPLVSLRVNASNDIAGTCVIEMKNQRFSMPDAKEYTLSNSSTTVTVERALVTSIVLGHSTLTMVTGDNVVVSAEVLPEFASMKDLEWSSSDPVVADVDATGSVTAGEPGTATITAAAMDGSGITATCEVTVYGIPVFGITLNRTSARLKVSESLQLTATVLPANAFVRDVIWSGSDDAVATVSETGIVTAVKEGSVTVTATSVSDPLISAACVITVIPTPVTEIRLSPASMRLKAGEQSELSVTVMPETATDKSISFSSSDPSVATVDEVGNILAVSVGTVYITVSALDGSDVSAVCAVTVDPTPVESVSISADGPTTIRVAQTVQLSASVLPSTATDKTVRWLSSDPSVATVDANGLVSAVSVGQTTINAIAGNRIDRILITVEPTPAESLTLNRNSVVMKVGGTMQIIATVGPVTATDKTVRYESTGKSVATVDDLGNVTAIGLGECEIIVSTLDGSGLAMCRLRRRPPKA